MSMLLRSAPLRAARIARVPQQARGVHIENKVDQYVSVAVFFCQLADADSVLCFILLRFYCPPRPWLSPPPLSFTNRLSISVDYGH